MSKNLKNLQTIVDSYDPYAIKIEQARKLASKWEKTGLLEGLDTEYDRNGMSILLENQAKQVLKEASSTTSGNGEEWSGVALPLVRRIFGEISAKELVSVQPMNLPSGLVFFMNFKYNTGDTNVHGTTEGSGAPTGGLYGAGAFGVSQNQLDSSALTAVTAAATSASLQYNDAYTVASYSTVTLPLSHSVNAYDKDGIRSFGLESGSAVTVLPQFTTVNAANTEIAFVVANAAATAGDYVVNYYAETSATSRGDFENPGTGNIAAIPEINLELSQESITAKTRKLKAVWTPEIQQDLNAYHAIDAEAELTSMLSEHIAMEIDLEVLDMLILGADSSYEWDAAKPTAAVSLSTIEYWQTFGVALKRVSNQIHAKTMRGGANFIVCSPDVATIIESLNGFAGSGDEAYDYAMGVRKLGELSKQWSVYKNPYMKENVVLVGFRGPSFLETGAVFAPYIPLIMTPLVYDPDSFTPRKGVMTRYAKKLVRPEFYGKIIVKNLQASL